MIGFIRNKSLPARRYLVLLVLPWCLMLLLTVAVLWPYLVGFRTTVKTLQDVQLPGILEAQRTRTNLNMLRKQLAIIYLAEAPLERRRARLHAQALLAGMAHDPSPVATEVLALGPRIRQLYVSRMEADKGLSRLHRHEMEMMLALNSLEQATGRKMAGEVIFSHTGRDGVRHGRMAFEKMQRLMAPVEQMCAGSEEFRDICDLFGKHKRALGEAWREKFAIDAQARALWQSLEDELLRLVNAVSSRELQRSLEEAESLSEAADHIVWSIFLFTLGLLAFLLVLLLLLRRDLLRPLVRIAGNLSRLRDGMQPEPIPAVRITELQEVVDIVPDIGGYLGSLRERSCRLEEEKDAYSRMSLMDSLTGIPNRRALDMRLRIWRSCGRRPASSCWMWTCSRSTTIRWDIRKETPACTGWPRPCATACAAATARSSATVGRSSPWSWTRCLRSMPCMWPSACARPWSSWASPIPAIPPGM